MNTVRAAFEGDAASPALPSQLPVSVPTQPARGERASTLPSDDDQVVRASHRCRSCNQPLHDPPTGLIERWNWDDRAAGAVARARHQRQSIALVMIDLDRFKEVNDAYGHLAGDAVLRGVADVLRNSTREGDLACRYGGAAGDEFLLLLPGTTLAEALTVAERIRVAINGMSVNAKITRELSTTINGRTASLGVAAYCPDDLAEMDLQDLMLDADVALRAAKRHGRDRICLANVDLSGEPVGQSQAGKRLASWSRFRRLRSV